MIILGIDPGLALVGYGLIEFSNFKYKMLEYGCITTTPETSTQDRLKIIYNEINNIILEYNPSEMAIEELFFNKNIKTAIAVGQARGVQILSGVVNNLKIYEYTPLQVKQAIVGYGRADKVQMQENIKYLLKLSEIPKPDDAADALAIALCHCFNSKFKYLSEMK